MERLPGGFPNDWSLHLVRGWYDYSFVYRILMMFLILLLRTVVSVILHIGPSHPSISLTWTKYDCSFVYDILRYSLVLLLRTVVRVSCHLVWMSDRECTIFADSLQIYISE